MYKKLARHGNSSALVLEKPILELLNITDTTQLKITTDGTSLIITPVLQPVVEQSQEEVLKPFKDLVNAMPKPEATSVYTDYAQNPTVENQKRVLEHMEKNQEHFKDHKFWETRKKVMDAYAPSLDEKMKAMMKEFNDVDLKQFPDNIQQIYLEVESAPTSPRSIEIMNSQEYIDAVKQIMPLLQAKFATLFKEHNAENADLEKEMHENFIKVQQEVAKETVK